MPGTVSHAGVVVVGLGLLVGAAGALRLGTMAGDALLGAVAGRALLGAVAGIAPWVDVTSVAGCAGGARFCGGRAPCASNKRWWCIPASNVLHM